MPFQTAGRRVFASYTDSFSRVGSSLGADWTMLVGTDGTHVQISGERAVRPPTNPGPNPQAAFERDIDPSLLARMVRASLSFRLQGAAPSDESVALLVYGFDGTTHTQACSVEMRWVQATNTVELRTEHRGNVPSAIPHADVTLNVWHRLGVELTYRSSDPMRAYLALGLTNIEDTPTNNANLSLVAEVPAGDATVSAPYRAGFSMGGEVALPGSPVTFDAFLVEEVEVLTFADPRFPQGTFFEVHDTPYTSYKTMLVLHDRLSRAQF